MIYLILLKTMNLNNLRHKICRLDKLLQDLKSMSLTKKNCCREVPIAFFRVYLPDRNK